MAEVTSNKNEYTITIKLDRPVKKPKEEKPIPLTNQASEAISFFKNNVVFKEVGNLASQSVSFYVTNIGLTTGNSESQARAQLALNVANKGALLAASIATGNIIGAGLLITNELLSIGFRQSQIDLQQNIESTNLAVSRTRAGIAFNSSRTGGTY